ncbi:MAG: helix-turn-helix domain-containing protein [Rhodospirillales bacterium]|nr:helix-turn-helix domain-containing protein [Rhodospirillales bacterium]MBT4039005.1 helix-turn-helix domain-containing protein [Rhodospirillales bacterium]MBT4628175.1 helix-turn-helix domain-containing protein [Rhodospirillales bacterium]MBT5353453.1 helix-turn-helix domain-containing protein [Rhodospirillales bacterium]MBT5522153.1 helix-turn-helix domain-containing protein [Rhodospirillales bacterium]
MAKIKKDVRQRSRKTSETPDTANSATGEACPANQCPGPDDDASGPNEQANDHGVSIDDAKLIKLAGLMLRGKNQLECAEIFGVTDRTIRNWIKRLDKNGLPNIGEIDLFAHFQMQLLKDEIREQQIEEHLRLADAQNDGRQVARLLNLQLKLSQQRWVRYSNLDPNFAIRTQLIKSDTPSSQHTDNIFSLMTGILTSPSFDHNCPEENANDDDENWDEEESWEE